MPRRRCPTGKIKHFNEAWAEIAAQRQSDELGSVFETYCCRCGWWHTYDRLKKRGKENQRESRNSRRRRAARGEPPPLQALREEQQRERRRVAQLRRRLRQELPLRVWEDDGGACIRQTRDQDDGGTS